MRQVRVDRMPVHWLAIGLHWLRPLCGRVLEQCVFIWSCFYGGKVGVVLTVLAQ